MYPRCIQDVSKLDTQSSLEVSEVEVSEVEVSKGEDIDNTGKNTHTPKTLKGNNVTTELSGVTQNVGQIPIESRSPTLEKIVDIYNQTCVSLPKVKILTEPRKRKLKTMLKKYSVEDFETVFKKAEENSFLKGGGERGWKADFDWLIKEDHIVKILEGGYTSEERKSKEALDMERDFKMYAEWAQEED